MQRDKLFPMDNPVAEDMWGEANVFGWNWKPWRIAGVLEIRIVNCSKCPAKGERSNLLACPNFEKSFCARIADFQFDDEMLHGCGIRMC